jgi:hypothetical protein
VVSKRHHDASQTARVLAFMQGGRSLESMEAIRRFGITRLASVIDDLRRAGHNITTELVGFKAQSGVYSRFARYRLVR